MTAPADTPQPGLELMRALIEAGDTARRERATEFDGFWSRVLHLAPRAKVIRENPDARHQVEHGLRRWRDVISDLPHVEWSKDRIDALAVRLNRLREDIAELGNDAQSLGHALRGHVAQDGAAGIFLAMAGALDATDPAIEAIECIAASLPTKKGGPGDLTANLRPKPLPEFASMAATIWRHHGLPLGGNASRDKSFEDFLRLAHEAVTGTQEVPGLGALLAAVRKG